MKKIFLSFALVLFTAAAISAQSVTPPSTASNHLAKNWTGASDISWSQVEALYVAKFTHNSNNMFAYYNDKGNLEKMKTQVLWANVPAEVMKGHKTSANNIYPPLRQYRVEANGVVTYEIVIETHPGHFHVMNFDTAGKILAETELEAGH